MPVKKAKSRRYFVVLIKEKSALVAKDKYSLRGRWIKILKI
jgi:hypothetical protein